MAVMGYLNPYFTAGFTLSINKKIGWEEAFDKIEDGLQKLRVDGEKFAPVYISRKMGTNRTMYVRSDHVVPETGKQMTVCHLVLRISDEERQRVAKKARSK